MFPAKRYPLLLLLLIASALPIQARALDIPSVSYLPHPGPEALGLCQASLDQLNIQIRRAEKQREIWSAIAAEPLAWKREIARVSMRHLPDLEDSPLTTEALFDSTPGTWAVVSRARNNGGYTLVTFGERTDGGRINQRGFYVLDPKGKLTSYSSMVLGSWQHRVLKKARWKSGNVVEYQYRVDMENKDLGLETIQVK